MTSYKKEPAKLEPIKAEIIRSPADDKDMISEKDTVPYDTIQKNDEAYSIEIEKDKKMTSMTLPHKTKSKMLHEKMNFY